MPTQAVLRGQDMGVESEESDTSITYKTTVHNLSFENKIKLKQMTSELSNINYLGVTAVPYEIILEVVNFLPYGNPVRVMFIMCFLTGCRLRELDMMSYNSKKNFIKGSRIFWEICKNQSGCRNEELPYWFLQEILYYRQTHRVPDNKLFGISYLTFRRYFNRDVRPKLGCKWRIKDPLDATSNNIKEYKFKLKGLRKSFATLYFANRYEYWKNDCTGALLDVSKRLKHSTLQMTAHHYLNEFEPLNMHLWVGMTPAEILALATQKHIPDFTEEINWNKLKHDNWQSRLGDF